MSPARAHPLDLQPVVPASARRARVPAGCAVPPDRSCCWPCGNSSAAPGVLAADVLASPGRIARVGWDLIGDGSLPSAMGTSLQRVALGLLFGTVTGTGLALLAGLFRIGEDLVDAPVQDAADGAVRRSHPAVHHLVRDR
ncbi:hypothetical protein LT493_01710 [Streptomyces tricolor]|nr:hypothetical protein [Streptomyces tricolor]